MVTYLVGTDGVPASETLCAYLSGEVDEDDHLEVMYVLTEESEGIELGDEVFVRGRQELEDVGAPSEDIEQAEQALAVFEERFGERVSLTTKMFNRGQSPADEIVDHAEAIGADSIVTALRRHSRTERIIFGSVSHSLLQKVTKPITLVPLEEYQPETPDAAAANTERSGG